MLTFDLSMMFYNPGSDSLNIIALHDWQPHLKKTR